MGVLGVTDRAAQGCSERAFGRRRVFAPGEGGRPCEGCGRMDCVAQRVLQGKPLSASERGIRAEVRTGLPGHCPLALRKRRRDI